MNSTQISKIARIYQDINFKIMDNLGHPGNLCPIIMLYTTKSESETKNIGKKIATQLKGGDVVLLYGDLGAGKTTLTKGIAEGLGIKKDILSPTFTLMNVYQVKSQKSKVYPERSRGVKSLIHVDTYRLEKEEQLIEIGVEDYLGQPDTVCIIEWPEKIEILLKNKKTITIKIEHDNNHPNNRTITYIS